MNRMVRLTACLLGLGLAAVACQSQNLKATVQHSPSVPSRWQQVDLPLMPEGTRKAVYDAARDSLWVVSLVPPQDPSASEYVTVTRVDASTHEVTQTGLHLKAHQFYQAAACGWHGIAICSATIRRPTQSRASPCLHSQAWGYTSRCTAVRATSSPSRSTPRRGVGGRGQGCGGVRVQPGHTKVGQGHPPAVVPLLLNHARDPASRGADDQRPANTG